MFQSKDLEPTSERYIKQQRFDCTMFTECLSACRCASCSMWWVILELPNLCYFIVFQIKTFCKIWKSSLTK